MKPVLTVLFLLSSAVAAHSQCDGPMGTRSTKNGGTMQVCLEPKYSTCIANNLNGGWTQQEAKARCDALRAAGKVK